MDNIRTHLWTIVCFLRFLNVRTVTQGLSLICFVGCGEGRFGPQCSFLCGHCLGGVVCDHVNGSCPAGCSKGWHGRYCNQSKCTVIKVLVSELNIANRLYDKVYNIWMDTKVTMWSVGFKLDQFYAIIKLLTVLYKTYILCKIRSGKK